MIKPKAINRKKLVALFLYSIAELSLFIRAAKCHKWI